MGTMVTENEVSPGAAEEADFAPTETVGTEPASGGAVASGAAAESAAAVTENTIQGHCYYTQAHTGCNKLCHYGIIDSLRS